MTSEARRVYTVTQVTHWIKTTLENEIGSVWIEGEVSNARRPSSGHCYFTLKDAGSQIKAVLFRGDQRGIAAEVKDGALLRVYGQVSVYEKSGEYQVIVRRVEPGGKGLLQQKFEELKERLRREGLFEAERKRPIPRLPRHVGIVTSPTGAAIRDILNILTRRFPNLHVVIAPVRVQGEGAAAEIAAAIELLNRRGGLDVLIIGRGGGSLEDLWCFNEEIVARAIVASGIPVISAVGHETDFTISDFVANLRAPTPSAAAELVVGRKDEFVRQVDDASRLLTRLLRACALEARTRVLRIAGSPVFREPSQAVARYRHAVEELRLRAGHEAVSALRARQQRLDDLGLRSSHAVRLWRQSCRDRLNGTAAHLRALDPLAVLQRGYSVTCDDQGRVVRRAATMRRGQRLTTRLAAGVLESEVTQVRDAPGGGRP